MLFIRERIHLWQIRCAKVVEMIPILMKVTKVGDPISPYFFIGDVLHCFYESFVITLHLVLTFIN